MQHFFSQRRITHGDDDHAGPHQTSRNQGILAPGVAKDHIFTTARRLTNPVGIKVKRNVTHMLLAKKTSQILTIAAKATEDGVFFSTH